MSSINPPNEQDNLEARVAQGSGVPDAPSNDDLGRFAQYRLNQDFRTAAPTKKVLTTVPVRKPNRHEFVRTSTILRFDTLTFATKDDNRIYLVDRGVTDEFPERLIPTLLVGTANRQGVFFLWPITLRHGDEPWNDWHRSAFDAMQEATAHWVRVTSNRHLGAYEVNVAVAPNLPEPQWPSEPFETLIELAFRDQIIDTMDHPVLKALRGEM